MKDSLYIKAQLDTILGTIPEQSLELRDVFKAKALLLTWLYNDGNCRTEDEIKLKLQTSEERQLALSFMGQTDPILEKTINMEIRTLKDILD